jgi:hypothetical protein
MILPRFPRGLAALLLLTGPGMAQTSVWTGQGPTGAFYQPAWEDSANWDTGVTPAGPAAVVVFPPGPSPAETTANVNPHSTINSAITVGEVRHALADSLPNQTGWDLWIGSTQVSPTIATTAGSLRLEGAGFTRTGSSPAGYARPPQLLVMNGTVTFANTASAGDLPIWLTTSRTSPAFVNASLHFHGQSTAGTSAISNGGTITFHDQASAAQAGIFVAASRPDLPARLNFLDSSGADRATLTIGDYGLINFGDQSSAQRATIRTRDSVFNFPLSGSVHFSGQATAGEATINVSHLAFSEPGDHQ